MIDYHQHIIIPCIAGYRTDVSDKAFKTIIEAKRFIIKKEEQDETRKLLPEQGPVQ
jgi:hypothetical protein